MADRTLQEYLQFKLSETGFALDITPEGDIQAWPRNANQEHAHLVIHVDGENTKITRYSGAYNRAKAKKAFAGHLQSWVALYKMGARS